MEHLEALCAERVAAVDENARNSLANIELLPAVAAKVKSTRVVITLYHNLGPFRFFLPRQLFLGVLSPLFE